MNVDILKHSQILWDYHTMESSIKSADMILVLGSHDTRPAVHAAKLFHEKKAKLVVCTGGYGKITRDTWSVPEGEHFKKILEELEVPSGNILVECTATNTGDNFGFSRSLLDNRNIEVNSGIIVTKPYMGRRAFATGSKQWSDIDWQVSGPNIDFLDYPNAEVSLNRTINLMVGDLQRIAIYPEKGFQIEQEIPKNVWESYVWLKNNGFDQFLIPE